MTNMWSYPSSLLDWEVILSFISAWLISDPILHLFLTDKWSYPSSLHDSTHVLYLFYHFTVGCKAVLRMGSISNNKNDGPTIAITDNGNYIVDLFFTAPIADVALAAKEIKATVGKWNDSVMVEYVELNIWYLIILLWRMTEWKVLWLTSDKPIFLPALSLSLFLSGRFSLSLYVSLHLFLSIYSSFSLLTNFSPILLLSPIPFIFLFRTLSLPLSLTYPFTSSFSKVWLITEFLLDSQLLSLWPAKTVSELLELEERSLGGRGLG